MDRQARCGEVPQGGTAKFTLCRVYTILPFYFSLRGSQNPFSGHRLSRSSRIILLNAPLGSTRFYISERPKDRRPDLESLTMDRPNGARDRCSIAA